MPSYAGSPFIGARRPTPLLPCLGILNSSRSSKSPYSFSVISQPPPLPSTKRIPLSASQTSILPAWTFQPLRSLPLKSGVKPLGTSSSPLQRGEGTKARLASSTNHKRLDTVYLLQKTSDAWD